MLGCVVDYQRGLAVVRSKGCLLIACLALSWSCGPVPFRPQPDYGEANNAGPWSRWYHKVGVFRDDFPLNPGLGLAVSPQDLHPPVSGWEHLAVEDLLPTSKADDLGVTSRARALGAHAEGQRSHKLTARERFEHSGSQREPEGIFRYRFSYSLDPSHDLTASVCLEKTAYTLRIRGGVVEAHPLSCWPMEFEWEILPGLRDWDRRHVVQSAQGADRVAARRKSKVEWASKGVIVPPDVQAVLQGKTVNLQRLVVETIPVFAANVPPFFQRNHSASPARRNGVGRPVCRKAVRLPWQDDQVDREVVHLNLGPLTRGYPAGLYPVRVSSLPNQVQDFLAPTIERIRVRAEDLLPILRSREPALWDVWGSHASDEDLAFAVFHRDLGGPRVERGLTGFLSGEQGVRKPGETIYLGFLIHDRDGVLSPNHPTFCAIHDPRGSLLLRQVKTDARDGPDTIEVPTRPESPTGLWTATVAVVQRTFTRNLTMETSRPNRLRASIEASFIPRNRSLRDFPKVGPLDPLKASETAPEVLGSSNPDTQGRTSACLHVTPLPFAPGPLTAQLELGVTEPCGQHSVDRQSRDFHPFCRFFRLSLPPGDFRGFLQTGVAHLARLAVVDTEGRLLPRRPVRIQEFTLPWRWWWANTDPRADYPPLEGERPILEATMSLSQGQGEWPLRIDHAEWGRVFTRATELQRGPSAGRIVFINWPGWAGGASDRGSEASVWPLFTGRKSYAPGDTAVVTFPSTAILRALVVGEGSGRVFRTGWTRTAAENIVSHHRIEANLLPNMSVHRSLFLSYPASPVRPLRPYGSLSRVIADPATRLNPPMEATEVFESQSTKRFTVIKRQGRSMAFTLALVDEGLHEVTSNSTLNSSAAFHGRQTSLMQHFNLDDNVARFFLDQGPRQLSNVGSEEAARPPLGPLSSTPFSPLVRFLGPSVLDRNGRNTQAVEWPPYVGPLHVMLSPVSEGKALGPTEKTIPVRHDLMVRAHLPRLRAPGEESDFPVTLFWTGQGAANVGVRVQAQGAAFVVGETSSIVRFTSPGEQTVTFRLQATEMGSAQIRVTASSGALRAEHWTEIPIRYAGRPITQVLDRELAPGQTWSAALDPPGLTTTHRLYAEVSRKVPLDVQRRLKYLIQYPYGCVEQIVSAAFPQIYLERITPLEPTERQKITEFVAAAVQRLSGYQNREGAFTYWPGLAKVNAWANAYGGHFLLEAQRAGYVVPETTLNAWLIHQIQEAQTFSASSPDQVAVQAYRLYLLALAGRPQSVLVNRLAEVGLEGTAPFHLAAAYAVAGLTAQAQALASRFNVTVPEYRQTGGNLGSTLRDLAAILEALIVLDDAPRASPLAREIAQRLASDRSESTLAVAHTLVALARYLDRYGGEGNGAGVIEWRGLSIPFSLQDRHLFRVELPPGSGLITLTNTSNTPLFARLIMEGIPPPTQEPTAANVIAMVVNYLDTSRRPLNIENLAQGTEILVSIQIRNLGPNHLDHVALTWSAPAGWEIVNPRLSQPSGNTFASYEDYRDDGVDSFLTFQPRQSLTLTYRALATHRGRFFLPAVTATAMYDPSIQAVVSGRWVRVRGPTPP